VEIAIFSLNESREISFLEEFDDFLLELQAVFTQFLRHRNAGSWKLQLPKQDQMTLQKTKP